MSAPKWHPEVLKPPAKEVLKAISAQSWISDFYLAGGTALALQFGHRPSVDLDFFTASTRLDGSRRSDFEHQLKTNVSNVSFEKEQSLDGTLHGTCQKVNVSWLRFPYPLLQPLLRWEGIPMAHPEDIGAMKLAALVGRGAKKDFIDLYMLATRVHPLSEFLNLARRKFSHSTDFHIQVVKALGYFEDAEAEPTPPVFDQSLTWPVVKRYFQKEADTLAKKLLKASPKK